MKAPLFLLPNFLVMALAAQSFSATYHFAADGDDSHSESEIQSPQTPGRSLSYASTLDLQEGDSLLFAAGDTLRGEVRISGAQGSGGAPVVIGGYGGSAPPVLMGTKAITSWAKISGSIYAATVDTAIYQLFCDGEPLILAREPNQGYYKVESVQDVRTRFTDSDIVGSIDWQGASVHVRSKPWSLDARVIAEYNSAAGTITLDRQANYDIKASNPYFINNHRAALDTAGEWYYDSAAGKVYVWLPDGGAPQDHALEGSVYEYGVYADSCSYVQVESLKLGGHYGIGIRLRGTVSNAVVTKNEVSYAGRVGISLGGGSDNHVIRNAVVGSNYYGIQSHTQNARIENNSIRRIGLKDRLLADGLGGGCCKARGLQSGGANTIISGNLIDSIGYNGIGFGGQDLVIEKNTITYFCLTTYDGSAIYTWSSDYAKPGAMGTVIRKNTIVGGAGPSGDQVEPGWWQNGIYLDDRTHDITVSGNTVINTYHGIFLHNGKRHVVRDNTIFRTYSDAFKFLEDDKGKGEPMEDNVVVGNTIVSAHQSKALLAHDGYLAPHPFARIDSNVYLNPFNQTPFTVANAPGYPDNTSKQRQTLSFTGWQGVFGQDRHSTYIDTHWIAYEILDTLSGNLLQSTTFTEGTDPWTCWPGQTCDIAHDANNGVLVYTNGSGGEGYSLAHAGTFAVDAGEYLLLSIEARSPDSATVRIEPRFSHSPWSMVADRKDFSLSPSWQTLTHVLAVSKTDDTVRVDFRITENDTVHLKRASLLRVTVEDCDWQDKLAIVYNDKSSARSAVLPEGNWLVAGTDELVSGSVQLEPYSSKVIIADSRPASNNPGGRSAASPHGAVHPRIRRHGRIVSVAACPIDTREIVIRTLLGRKALAHKVAGTTGTVDLSSVAPGVYLVEILRRDGSILRPASALTVER